MKVLRVYHGGRDATHRERDRALVRAGVDLALVVPATWPPGGDSPITESFEVWEVPVSRAGDVNRHRYTDPSIVTDLIAKLRPDVLDLHEEPFSSVVHQLLQRIPSAQPVVTYAAQNIDKRFPPPFAQWERKALGRIRGIYPCTRQAGSVVVGKGFTGAIRVLPLAPSSEMTLGDQRPPTSGIRLLLVGRLVPEKGVLDAIGLLAEVVRQCPATLLLVGEGPEAMAACRLADELGVSSLVDIRPWASPAELAEYYRNADVVLAPSLTTRTWVEQFGRMVGEAQAAGAVVVGYATGSLTEVVGTAGILVAEGDVTALARAVVDLHQRSDRWLALRDAGRERASGRTWDVVAAGQVELYTLAVGANMNPASVIPRRSSAATMYGEPALVAGGGRPFALPILRQDNASTRFLARALDTAAHPEQRPRRDRLKIVYLDHVARLSGAELALSRLIAALPDIDAHVILGEDGPLRDALEHAGATVEVLPLDPRLRDTRRTEVATGVAGIRSIGVTMLYCMRLARRLRSLQPDIVHTNSLKSGFYGSVAARLAGRPVVWHVRDRIADDYLPARVVRLTRLALRCLPDFVVGNSGETLRTTGVDRKGERGRHILPSRPAGGKVIYGVIDAFGADEGSPATSHQRLIIGTVGRIAPWKGQDVFVRAFHAAFAESPEVSARIIGSAMFGEQDYEASVRTLVTNLDLDGRIVFVGFSSEVAHELSTIDFLVHASTVPEPFGQVVVEGMAARLPVIAAAAGGPLEIITNDVDGLLTPPGDIDALAAAMRRLAADPQLRIRLSRAAVLRSRDFGPDTIGKEWMAVYQEMAAKRLRHPMGDDGARRVRDCS